MGVCTFVHQQSLKRSSKTVGVVLIFWLVKILKSPPFSPSLLIELHQSSYSTLAPFLSTWCLVSVLSCVDLFFFLDPVFHECFELHWSLLFPPTSKNLMVYVLAQSKVCPFFSCAQTQKSKKCSKFENCANTCSSRCIEEYMSKNLQSPPKLNQHIILLCKLLEFFYKNDLCNHFEHLLFWIFVIQH